MESLNIFIDSYPSKTCSQFFAFGPRWFLTLAPQNVEAILSSSFSDFGFGQRASVFRPLLGNGIFTQEGMAWKHSRQMLRKQLAGAHYQTVEQFDEHLDNMLARLPESGAVDLQPLFFDFTLDTSTALLLGQSVYSLKCNEYHLHNKAFGDGFLFAMEGLARRFRIVPFQFLYNSRKFRSACRDVHSFVEGYIRSRREQEAYSMKTKSSGLLEKMAAEGFSDEDTRDQVLNVLLSGRDTTAACLSWTL